MNKRTLNTKVAGVTFEGRQAYIAKLSGGEPCRIVPEPDNKYDPNALAVHVSHNGTIYHVGYIPKELAAEIAPHLDGEAIICSIAGITGGFQLGDTEDYAAYGLLIRIELPGLDEVSL